MAKPHVCPSCKGKKVLKLENKMKPCPTCDNTGVVWEKEGQEILRKN